MHPGCIPSFPAWASRHSLQEQHQEQQLGQAGAPPSQQAALLLALVLAQQAGMTAAECHGVAASCAGALLLAAAVQLVRVWGQAMEPPYPLARLSAVA